MDAITLVMLAFSVLGALDRIIGDKFGLGKEFEKGFLLLGNLSLAMIGMIVISPYIATLLQPVFSFVSDTLGFEPSIIPATLFSNDVGGASLAVEVAADAQMGAFNGLVVASMMGATISFNVPFSLSTVNKEKHRELMLGLLCGIIAIPVGSFFAGLFAGLPAGALFKNLLPIILISALIAFGLMKAPGVCVKFFGWLGTGIKILITIGLSLAIIRFLTGKELLPGLATLEEAMGICLSCAVIMTGAFPLLHILSKLLKKPLGKMGRMLHVNDASMMGFLSTLASSMPTFENMKDMDKKGLLLNAAFAVPAGFVLADHLAFTLAFNSAYVAPMMIGKLLSGLLAVGAALFLGRRMNKDA